jgi:hypothetical protein
MFLIKALGRAGAIATGMKTLDPILFPVFN